LDVSLEAIRYLYILILNTLNDTNLNKRKRLKIFIWLDVYAVFTDVHLWVKIVKTN